MARKTESTFDRKFQEKLAQYAKAFRIEDLNDANDKSTLDIMLKTEVMIDDLQEQIQDLMSESSADNVNSIKKLHDLLRDASTMIVTYQKTLAIDRKTRKTEETASVADYIRGLKRDAKDFMDQRVIRTYCPNCKIMVGRIFPVHEHTAFACSFECSQCHKLIRARREQRDVLFDVKDASWRREHPAEIEQPKKFTRIEAPEDEGDELVLMGAQPELIDDQIEPIIPIAIEEGLELGEE